MKKTVMIMLSVLFAMVLSVCTFAANTTLEAAIEQAVAANKSELDISSYNVDPETALKAYFDLHNTNPNFVYADNNARCEYEGSYAKRLIFSYKASADVINKEKAAVNAEINKIAELAKAGANDVEKVKIVHDYIITNSSYDQTMTSMTPYGLLVGKKGVCISYSYTFKMIMDSLGINCEISNSVAMAHSWNVVKIDGDWYNVDLTYDSVSHAQLGSITYANSLKSDSYFKTVGYINPTVKNNIVCTNSQYDTTM